MRTVAVFLCSSLIAAWPLATSAQDEDLLLPKIERELEEWRHVWLARTQAQTTVSIQAFTSDGCSGGLSSGWQWFARQLPAFAEKFGDRPPYESCCVIHDRAYWRGETEQGFDKRLQADVALRNCVIEYGEAHSAEFAERFGLSRAVIERHFTLSAGLMFRAVRAGGVPCSGLPWRWGYGWPDCAEQAYDK